MKLTIKLLNYFLVSGQMTVTSNSGYKGYERSFCIRMKSTLTKRGCHFKSSGYRVSFSSFTFFCIINIYLNIFKNNFIYFFLLCLRFIIFLYDFHFLPHYSFYL